MILTLSLFPFLSLLVPPLPLLFLFLLSPPIKIRPEKFDILNLKNDSASGSAIFSVLAGNTSENTTLFSSRVSSGWKRDSADHVLYSWWRKRQSGGGLR